MVILLAVAASAATKLEPEVVIYLHHGTENAAIIAGAEEQAQRMLGSIGISVAWRIGTPGPCGNAEVVEVLLSEGEMAEELRPGSLAFATLGARTGTRIQVFYKRVQASGPPSAVPSILAHVLVHEITHILEGVDRHSETGIMKPHWDAEDFRAMRKALPFAGEDVRLVRAWAERHHRTLLAAAR